MSLYHEKYNPPESIKEEEITTSTNPDPSHNDNQPDQNETGNENSSSNSNTKQEANENKRKKAVDLSLHEPAFDKDSNELFDLFAVIIHTGTSGEYGHYHAYIKDLLNKGNWKYYKDENDYDKEIDNQYDVYINNLNNSSKSNHRRSASDGPKVNIDEEMIQACLLAENSNSNIMKHEYITTIDNESIPDSDNTSITWNPTSLSTMIS